MRAPVTGIVLCIFKTHSKVKHGFDVRVEFVFFGYASAGVYVIYAQEHITCKSGVRPPAFTVHCDVYARIDKRTVSFCCQYLQYSYIIVEVVLVGNVVCFYCVKVIDVYVFDTYACQHFTDMGAYCSQAYDVYFFIAQCSGVKVFELFRKIHYLLSFLGLPLPLFFSGAACLMRVAASRSIAE